MSGGDVSDSRRGSETKCDTKGLSGRKHEVKIVGCIPEPLAEWGPILRAYYENPARHAMELQLWATHTRVRALQRALWNWKNTARGEYEDAIPVLLVERSVASDLLVFGRARREAGLLSDPEWDLLLGMGTGAAGVGRLLTP